MIEFVYDEEKEKWLNEHRNVSFKMVISKIENGEVEIIIPNPNQSKYEGQEAFVVEIDGYNCVVPFTESENKVVLKTIFKDRKINKRFQND
jgi:uncharacterized DUF497 family protein